MQSLYQIWTRYVKKKAEIALQVVDGFKVYVALTFESNVI